MIITVEVDLGLATLVGVVPSSSPPQTVDREARHPILQHILISGGRVTEHYGLRVFNK